MLKVQLVLCSCCIRRTIIVVLNSFVILHKDFLGKTKLRRTTLCHRAVCNFPRNFLVATIFRITNDPILLRILLLAVIVMLFCVNRDEEGLVHHRTIHAIQMVVKILRVCNTEFQIRTSCSAAEKIQEKQSKVVDNASNCGPNIRWDSFHGKKKVEFALRASSS